MDNASGLTTVRALLKVNEVTHFDHGVVKVKMSTIYGKDAEAESFAQASPGGTFEIYINTARAASKFFVPGDEIYFDFTKRAKPEAVVV